MVRHQKEEERTVSGEFAPSGSLALTVERDFGALHARAYPTWKWKLKNFLQNSWRHLPALAFYRTLGQLFGVVYIESALYLQVLRADGTIENLGCVGRRVVTTAGVNYLVDCLQGSVEPENLKWHGFGTGTSAESASDTALGTEFTTEYVTNSTRITDSQGEGASANIYRTVGTFSPDSGGTLAVTEHGVFSASSSGTLLDRTKFAAVNLTAPGDSLVATYELTLASGS